jgi:hypothetical protein
LRKMRLKEAHLDAMLAIQEKQHEFLQVDRARLATVSRPRPPRSLSLVYSIRAWV